MSFKEFCEILKDTWKANLKFSNTPGHIFVFWFSVVFCALDFGNFIGDVFTLHIFSAISNLFLTVIMASCAIYWVPEKYLPTINKILDKIKNFKIEF